MDLSRHDPEIDVNLHGRLQLTVSPARTQAPASAQLELATAASRIVSARRTITNGGAQ
jgi:hypothetical protein